MTEQRSEYTAGQPSGHRDLARYHALACAAYAVSRSKPQPKKQRQANTPRLSGYGSFTDGIIRYLAANGPATAAGIAQSFGVDKDKMRYRCKQLYAQGRLVHVAEGKGNVPAVYGLEREPCQPF